MRGFWRGEGTGGSDVVKVAYAKDSAQAGLIQGLLENEGIPSMLQALGIDGPKLGFGLLVSNPQRVMVRADQAERARALIAETLVGEEEINPGEISSGDELRARAGRKPRSYGVIGGYARMYFWGLGLITLAFAIFVLLRNV